ncbi:RNA polymerase sigma factor [Fodinicola acaciae]|uniref:RNA polymerase sigma factor n=1 Tax=Fodinicola acaciae TaxID=2681555 RepID=UPI0013D4AB28|nr:sigma-70 family RNA polymerase sigma factor [Fodinicola acaciae]
MTVRPDPALGLLELYDEALPQVYGYLLARCGDPATAEDLTAESFLAAVAACRKPEAPELSVRWLIGVARHKLVDHWRDRDRRRTEPLADRDPSCDPWDVQLDVTLAHQVLGRLSYAHRAALTLRYLDGLPVAEVAACLDRTLHATEALLMRAKRAFRAAYEGEEGLR